MSGLISSQNFGRAGQVNNPAWSLKKTSSQDNISTGSQVDVTWQETKFMLGGCTLSGNTVVVPISGLYSIDIQIQLNAATNDGNYIDLRFIVGSSIYQQSFRTEERPASEVGRIDSIYSHIILQLATADALKAAIYIDGGSPTTDISGGDSGTFFSGRYLGH